jgi:prolyl-tRNA editing enzyme YbaK/EbsC (Cys-tRNA(Pro) deacylase)
VTPSPMRWVSADNRGVPPFGHTTHLRVFIGPDLLVWPEVWAAAGTWNDVLGLQPRQLVEASAGPGHRPQAQLIRPATVRQ